MASTKMHGLLCLLLFLLQAQAWVPARLPTRANYVFSSSKDNLATSSPDAGLYEAIIDSLADASFLKLTVSSNSAETVDDDATCVFNDPLYRLMTVYGRLVALKSGPHLQLLLKYQHRDVTKNVPLGPALASVWGTGTAEAARSNNWEDEKTKLQGGNLAADNEVVSVLQSLIRPSAFRRARLFTTAKDVDLKLKASGSGKLAVLKPSLKPLSKKSLPSEADGKEGNREGSSALGATKQPVVQLQSHDRAKVVPVPPASLFLQRLGVTKADGKPSAGMAPKLRQIQKFVEVLEGLVIDADAQDRRYRLKTDEEAGNTNQKRPLNLRDFGCGRGYLTFAAHAYFASATTTTTDAGAKQEQQPRWAVTTVGVELRHDLVEETNKIARGLNPGIFEGLSFEEAAIADYVHAQAEGSIGIDDNEPDPVKMTTDLAISADDNDEDEDIAESNENEAASLPPLEVLVALHACDTATDDALWAGLQGGAHVIVTAPCCHKEVRKQLNAASSASSSISASFSSKEEGSEALHPLADVLRFGTLRERHAEMATDAVRALLLEMAGYDVRVFEFIGGEHTAKNVMVAAVKRSKLRSDSEVADLTVRLQNLCALYGLKQQHLARWMGVNIIQGATEDEETGSSASDRQGSSDRTRKVSTRTKAWRFPKY